MTQHVNTLNESYPGLTISGVKFNLRPVWEGASDNTILALAFHGLKQKAGDAFSTFKGTQSEKTATAQKVLDNLSENILRMDSSDPISTECNRIARAMAAAWWKKTHGGKTASADEYKSTAYQAKVTEYAKRADVKEKAQANVDALAELEL